MEPRVCLATPMFDKPHAAYGLSLNRALLSGAIAEYLKIVGSVVHVSRNSLVQLALEHKHTHIWMIDEYQFGFGAEMLKGLLSHDVDVVTPLRFMRQAPFEPTICYLDQEGRPRPIVDYPRRSFFEVDAVSIAGCLIKTSVFEKIRWPWFQPGITPDRKWISEDLMFCRALRDAGIKIFADTNYCISHMIEWPVDEDTFDVLRKEKEEEIEKLKTEWRDLLA